MFQPCQSYSPTVKLAYTRLTLCGQEAAILNKPHIQAAPRLQSNLLMEDLSMVKKLTVILLSLGILLSTNAFATLSQSTDGSSNPDSELFSKLLDKCGTGGVQADACKAEAREAAIQIRQAGTPVKCRKLRDIPNASDAYYACLRQFAGTPQPCRKLRDNPTASIAYYSCLRQFSSTSGQTQQAINVVPETSSSN